MISIKRGVSISKLQPQIIIALIVADEVYTSNLIPLVWTSGDDGNHGPSSLHYDGKAVDLRLPSWYYKDQTALDTKVTVAIKERLGEEFDVVLEGDHIHVEYDPRTPSV